MRRIYATGLTFAVALGLMGCANPGGGSSQPTETGTVVLATKTDTGCRLKLNPSTEGLNPYTLEVEDPQFCPNSAKGGLYQRNAKGQVSITRRVTYVTVGKGKTPMIQDDGTDNNACKLKLEWTDAGGQRHSDWSLANKNQCDGYVYGGTITQTQWTAWTDTHRPEK